MDTIEFYLDNILNSLAYAPHHPSVVLFLIEERKLENKRVNSQVYQPMKNKRQNKHLQLEANQCSVQGCKNKEDSCFIDECTLQNKED